jgi:23S rRNA (cytidine1920-2'-O)/16S rRNA (cytidine1409-2'-O)-methyltransferase
LRSSRAFSKEGSMIGTQKDTDRVRLDELLVGRGLYASRSRARDAIGRGAVAVDGAVARKAGQPVSASSDIRIDDPAGGYVSRAALKLIAGLDRFNLDPAGSTALDIGASTGGFTQVLLERGAAHVTAIDVGHGQMDPRLKSDPRVTSIEGLNARNLSQADLGGRLQDFLVCDVSFISLTLALPPALDLAAPGAKGVFLVKPQFEAGRAAIGKGGILKNPEDGPKIAARLRLWLDEFLGWRALGVCPSPVEGGDGNREFLLAGVKDR